MYTGYKEIMLNNDELANFYSTHSLLGDFYENEYIILKDQSNEVIDYYQYHNNGVEKVNYPIFDNSLVGKVKPRNPHQYCAMSLLKDERIPVKLITGCFGSGKSLLCIVAALDALMKEKFDKIIFVRNNVQVANTDALGALPGDQYDKTLPYLMPFADHCGGQEGVERLMANGQLEVIPLAFLRGRSIRNSIIYSMESENLTKEHIQLIMGRVDEGSQLWLDGDSKQRDRAIFDKSRGLEMMIERLAGNSLFGYVHLQKSERSDVARLCDLLD